MNISFRRFLKHTLKNAQRVTLAERDKFIQSQLIPHGLWANTFDELNYALVHCHKARGRTFRRIGNAAKKNKQIVDIFSVAIAIERDKDVRKIPFFRPVIIKTTQEEILWKVWPAKPVERKIGV